MEPFSSASTIQKYTFTETQIELEDSLLQLFSEPEEITFLNVDKHSKGSIGVNLEPNIALEYWFDLGQEIRIEGRQVTSFPVLFGDISGLKDFFNFFIVFCIGGF